MPPRTSITYADAGEIISTTLEARMNKGRLADNLTTHSAILSTLNRQKKPFSGGRSIEETVMYEQNPSFQFYEGSEKVNLEQARVSTMASFMLKEAAIAVTITNRDILMNSGKAKVIDLMKMRLMNMEKSFGEQMGRASFLPGTEFQGKAIGGMQHLISNNGEGTVGGLNAAEKPWWKNKVVDVGGNLTKANVQNQISQLYQRLIRGSDMPTNIFAPMDFYLVLEQAIQTQYRQMDAKVGKTSFPTLKYQNMEVTHDNYCPENTVYMVNPKYLHFRPHANQDYKTIGGDRMTPDQTVTTRLVGWAGNLTVSNRALQGVLKFSGVTFQ